MMVTPFAFSTSQSARWVPGGTVEWPQERACRTADLNLFFPVEASATPEAVIRMCSGCPARVQCLNFAIAGEERHGFWGGLSVRERERLVSNRPHRGPVPVTTPCPRSSKTQRFNEHLMLGEDPYDCAVCVARRIEQAARYQLREAVRKAKEAAKR